MQDSDWTCKGMALCANSNSLRHPMSLKNLGYIFQNELKDKLINSNFNIFVAYISRCPAYKKWAKYPITGSEYTHLDEHKTIFRGIVFLS